MVPRHPPFKNEKAVIIITVGICIILLCYIVISKQQPGSQQQTELWQPGDSLLSFERQADVKLYQHQEESHLTPEQQALVEESMARYIQQERQRE